MHNTYLVYLFENTEDWRDDSAVKDIRYSSTRPEFDFFFFFTPTSGGSQPPRTVPPGDPAPVARLEQLP